MLYTSSPIALSASHPVLTTWRFFGGLENAFRRAGIFSFRETRAHRYSLIRGWMYTYICTQIRPTTRRKGTLRVKKRREASWQSFASWSLKSITQDYGKYQNRYIRSSEKFYVSLFYSATLFYLELMWNWYPLTQCDPLNFSHQKSIICASVVRICQIDFV